MSDPALVLGIETSCDDTGVALVRDGVDIVAHATSRQDDLHARFGGVVPEVASRCHSERIAPLVTALLDEAGVSLSDLDAIAYTEGPGLIGSLLVGSNFGKTLAFRLGVPAVAVHHLEAHLYSARFEEPNLTFPHLGLLVSGGHTSLYIVRSWEETELLGQTLDDAAGEAFDKVAKLLGLGYPGGPAIQNAATEATDPRPVLPTPRTPNPLDVSLSGLKSAVSRLAQTGTFAPEAIADAFQSKVVEMLVTRVLKAAEEHDLRQVTLTGGVAANAHLRKELALHCAQKQLHFVAAPLQLAMDNGSMVGGLGYHLLQAGRLAALDAGAFSTTRSIPKSGARSHV